MVAGGSTYHSIVAALAESRSARRSDGYVSYQVLGQGPIDLVVSIDHWMVLDLLWDEPAVFICALS